jgi:hypothetical protein
LFEKKFEDSYLLIGLIKILKKPQIFEDIELLETKADYYFWKIGKINRLNSLQNSLVEALNTILILHRLIGEVVNLE